MKSVKIQQLLTPEEKKIVELISKSIIKKTFSLGDTELTPHDSLLTSNASTEPFMNLTDKMD